MAQPAPKAPVAKPPPQPATPARTTTPAVPEPIALPPVHARAVPLDLSTIRTRSLELPHRDVLQRLFGPEHDLTTIRAHIGGDAIAATRARSALAYARGDEIFFRGPPDLALAAHEAAHVIQQRRGGAPSGRESLYEQHADQVADRVLAGRSAADLFARLPSATAVVQTQHSGESAGSHSNILSRAQLDEKLARAVDTAKQLLFNEMPDYIMGPGGAIRPELTEPSIRFTADASYPAEVAVRFGEDAPTNTLAFTDKRTGVIRVRESITRKADDPFLTAIVLHELLHTLCKWRPFGSHRTLDEAATQFLTLAAFFKEAFPSDQRIQSTRHYARETLAFTRLLRTFGIKDWRPVADAYFKNQDGRLVAIAETRFGVGKTNGWYLVLACFSGDKFKWDFWEEEPTISEKIGGMHPLDLLTGLLDETIPLTVNADGFAHLGPPDKHVQRSAVSGAPAQDPDELLAAAALGTRGPGERLPHLDRIQRSFGRHDISTVRAHTDPAAAAAARSLRAAAFTTGDHVAFARSPSLRVAAHEAAHAVQQRRGVDLPRGIDTLGDRYERHADAVADLVVQGRSAESLLSQGPDADAPPSADNLSHRPGADAPPSADNLSHRPDADAPPPADNLSHRPGAARRGPPGPTRAPAEHLSHGPASGPRQSAAIQRTPDDRAADRSKPRRRRKQHHATPSQPPGETFDAPAARADDGFDPHVYDHGEIEGGLRLAHHRTIGDLARLVGAKLPPEVAKLPLIERTEQIVYVTSHLYLLDRSGRPQAGFEQAQLIQSRNYPGPGTYYYFALPGGQTTTARLDGAPKIVDAGVFLSNSPGARNIRDAVDSDIKAPRTSPADDPRAAEGAPSENSERSAKPADGQKAPAKRRHETPAGNGILTIVSPLALPDGQHYQRPGSAKYNLPVVFPELLKDRILPELHREVLRVREELGETGLAMLTQSAIGQLAQKFPPLAVAMAAKSSLDLFSEAGALYKAINDAVGEEELGLIATVVAQRIAAEAVQTLLGKAAGAVTRLSWRGATRGARRLKARAERRIATVTAKQRGPIRPHEVEAILEAGGWKDFIKQQSPSEARVWEARRAGLLELTRKFGDMRRVGTSGAASDADVNSLGERALADAMQARRALAKLLKVSPEQLEKAFDLNFLPDPRRSYLSEHRSFTAAQRRMLRDEKAELDRKVAASADRSRAGEAYHEGMRKGPAPGRFSRREVSRRRHEIDRLHQEFEEQPTVERAREIMRRQLELNIANPEAYFATASVKLHAGKELGLVKHNLTMLEGFTDLLNQHADVNKTVAKAAGKLHGKHGAAPGLEQALTSAGGVVALSKYSMRFFQMADQLGLPVDGRLAALAAKIRNAREVHLPDDKRAEYVRELLGAQKSLIALARAKIAGKDILDEAHFSLRQTYDDHFRKINDLIEETTGGPGQSLIHRSIAHLLALEHAEDQRTRSPGHRPAIQKAPASSADPADEPAHVHAAAALGTRCPGGPLPHLDTIQRSFGRHDVSRVRAHTDAAAATAAATMHASAFTAGDRVAFARSPSLRTAAHEATHAVQQRRGVAVQRGVGAPGDRYERHADAVADLVAHGRSAESLLSHGPGGEGSPAAAIQREAAPPSPTPAAAPVPDGATTTDRMISRLWSGNALIAASPPDRLAAAAIAGEVLAWMNALAADGNKSKRLMGHPYTRVAVEQLLWQTRLDMLVRHLRDPAYTQLVGEYRIVCGHLAVAREALLVLNGEIDVARSQFVDVDKYARLTTLALAGGLAAAPLAVATTATLLPLFVNFAGANQFLFYALVEIGGNTTMTVATATNRLAALTDPVFLLTNLMTLGHGWLMSRSSKEIIARILRDMIARGKLPAPRGPPLVSPHQASSAPSAHAPKDPPRNYPVTTGPSAPTTFGPAKPSTPVWMSSHPTADDVSGIPPTMGKAIVGLAASVEGALHGRPSTTPQSTLPATPAGKPPPSPGASISIKTPPRGGPRGDNLERMQVPPGTLPESTGASSSPARGVQQHLERRYHENFRHRDLVNKPPPGKAPTSLADVDPHNETVHDLAFGTPKSQGVGPGDHGDVIITHIAAKNGATGQLDNTYDPTTGTLGIETVMFDRALPRRVGPDDTGMSTATYANLRAIKQVAPGFKPGDLKAVTIAEVMHLKTILEYNTGVPLAQTRLGQMAADVARQTGGKITDGKLTSKGFVAPLGQLIDNWAASTTPKHVIDAMLKEHGLTRESLVRSHFYVHFDVVPEDPPVAPRHPPAPDPHPTRPWSYPTPSTPEARARWGQGHQPNWRGLSRSEIEAWDRKPPNKASGPALADTGAGVDVLGPTGAGPANPAAAGPVHVNPAAVAAKPAHTAGPATAAGPVHVNHTNASPARIDLAAAEALLHRVQSEAARLLGPTKEARSIALHLGNISPGDRQRLVLGWGEALIQRHEAELAGGKYVTHDIKGELTRFGVPDAVQQDIYKVVSEHYRTQAYINISNTGVDAHNAELVAKIYTRGAELARSPHLQRRWADVERRYPNWSQVEAYFEHARLPESEREAVRRHLIDLDGHALGSPGLPRSGVDYRIQTLAEFMFNLATSAKQRAVPIQLL